MSPPSKPLHVLVVDDEESLRLTFEVCLTVASYRVTTAESGDEAVEVAKRDLPQVVILDNRLRDEAGIEVGKRLREMGCDSPICLCSAHIDDELILQAIPLGIVDFMGKPLTPDQLRWKVGKIAALEESSSGGFDSALDQVRSRNFGDALETIKSIDPETPRLRLWSKILSTLVETNRLPEDFSQSGNLQQILFEQN